MPKHMLVLLVNVISLWNHVLFSRESRRKTPFVVSMNGNEREFGDPAMVVVSRKSYIFPMQGSSL